MVLSNAKKTAKELTFGKLSLPVKKEGGPFVPSLMNYTDHDKILETVTFAINMNMPVLLIGETGVGKTSAIRYLASATNTNLRRVNVNGSMTAEDFVGQLLVDKTGTYWKDGVLTEAMRNGWWIVIDEINAASAEILFVLHSLMDDDRYIVLTDHPQREIVRAHKDFRLFATMNPPERYSGTKDMNKALLSRFGLTITVPIPPEHVEFTDISNADKLLTKDELGMFKSFITELRKAYHKEELEVFISPRDVAHIMKVYLFTNSLIAAIEKTVAPRGTKTEQKVIMDMARLHLTKKKTKAKGESKLKRQEEVAEMKKKLSALSATPFGAALDPKTIMTLYESFEKSLYEKYEDSEEYLEEEPAVEEPPKVETKKDKLGFAVNDYVMVTNGDVYTGEAKIAKLGGEVSTGHYLVQRKTGGDAKCVTLNGFVPDPSYKEYWWVKGSEIKPL